MMKSESQSKKKSRRKANELSAALLIAMADLHIGKSAILSGVTITKKEEGLFDVTGLDRFKMVYDVLSDFNPEKGERSLNTTQIARVLMAMSMHRTSPVLSVLYLMLNDMQPLLQFCILFGDESLPIPTLDKVVDAISVASDLSKGVERGTISGDNALYLSSLVTKDATKASLSDMEFNSTLYDFLQESFTATIKAYSNLQSKVLESVNVCDPDSIAELYKVLSRESKAQLNLSNALAKSMGILNENKVLKAKIKELVKEREND